MSLGDLLNDGNWIGVALGGQTQDILEGKDIIVSGYEWVYGDFFRLRPFEPHVELDGVEFENFDDPVLANPDTFPDTAFYQPGDHDGCCAAGTIASGPVAQAATLRWFEGELIELTTASGDLLTVTPNHPILTRKGWKPAGLLDEGDEVVRCADVERASSLVPDEYQRPALIEDVARACGVTSVVVPVSPEHFHGDGQGSQVCVVRFGFEADVDGSSSYVEELRESIDAFPGELQFDNLLHIDRRSGFSGHVYNLQTATGWYIASNIIVHNCVCDFLPTVQEGSNASDLLSALIEEVTAATVTIAVDEAADEPVVPIVPVKRRKR